LATFFSGQVLGIRLDFSAADLPVPGKRGLYMLNVMLALTYPNACEIAFMLF
jgi:hypothetical protein